eukprot:3890536-Amphidinium_carterae.2
MWERSSGSSLHRTQSSPTWKAVLVTVCAYFVPHSAEGSIERTSEALLSLVGTALQVPEALRAEAGFQASKVSAAGGHISEQNSRGVPLNF